jgi:hypothetical protein
MDFVLEGNPTKSGVYQVDRGPLGKPFRYYNADTDSWALVAYELEEAIAVKDVPTVIGFLPWVGPVKQKKAPSPTVSLVGHALSEAIVATAEAKAPTKSKVKTEKTKHPDGTIFFREDRQKWVVVIDGKQPAARPTKEGVVKWLATKHPKIKPTILQ